MVDIRIHPEAREDYRSALAWYHDLNARAADRFEAEFDRVLVMIADRPELFPKCDDDHQFAMFHRFPYTAIYRVFDGEIIVMAVAHSSREVNYWRDRD